MQLVESFGDTHFVYQNPLGERLVVLKEQSTWRAYVYPANALAAKCLAVGDSEDSLMAKVLDIYQSHSSGLSHGRLGPNT